MALPIGMLGLVELAELLVGDAQFVERRASFAIDLQGDLILGDGLRVILAGHLDITTGEGEFARRCGAGRLVASRRVLRGVGRLLRDAAAAEGEVQ